MKSKMSSFANRVLQNVQISKLENNATNVTMETILRVFNALKAKISFKVELKSQRIRIA